MTLGLRALCNKFKVMKKGVQNSCIPFKIGECGWNVRAFEEFGFDNNKPFDLMLSLQDE